VFGAQVIIGAAISIIGAYTVSVDTNVILDTRGWRERLVICCAGRRELGNPASRASAKGCRVRTEGYDRLMANARGNRSELGTAELSSVVPD
jgi:hypothetical protein